MFTLGVLKGVAATGQRRRPPPPPPGAPAPVLTPSGAKAGTGCGRVERFADLSLYIHRRSNHNINSRLKGAVDRELRGEIYIKRI